MDKFLRLKIKTKLTFGIGLLFTMIVLLGGLAGGPFHSENQT